MTTKNELVYIKIFDFVKNSCTIKINSIKVCDKINNFIDITIPNVDSDFITKLLKESPDEEFILSNQSIEFSIDINTLIDIINKIHKRKSSKIIKNLNELIEKLKNNKN